MTVPHVEAFKARPLQETDLYNVESGELVERPEDIDWSEWDEPTESPYRFFASDKKGVVRKVFICVKIKRFSDIDNVRECYRCRFHVYLADCSASGSTKQGASI